jgi:hypothetical protein
MNDATLLCKQAFENLSDEEVQFLKESMKMIPITKDRPSYAKANRKFDGRMEISWNGFLKQKKFFERYKNIEEKVDMEKIVKAGTIVTSAIENAMPILEKFSNFDLGEPIFSLWPFLAIGGPFPNHYERSYFLIIDLGGNDVYENNAGGPVFLFEKPGWYRIPAPGQVSICIDLWGDDTYSNGGQGFGFAGIGILVDNFGSDKYSEGNQGYGAIFGIGILLDKHGCDIYFNGWGGQGVGFVGGMGILLDRGGNDKYIYAGWWYESIAQGAGMGGTGILIDYSGDDTFSKSRERSQGYGIYGIGILINILGNDDYSGPGKDWSIWFQGFIGIGIDIGGRP